MTKDDFDVEGDIQLKPKPRCKDCLGRGYVRIIPTHLDANKYREIRPCHCVKAIVKLKDLPPDKKAIQGIIK